MQLIRWKIQSSVLLDCRNISELLSRVSRGRRRVLIIRCFHSSPRFIGILTVGRHRVSPDWQGVEMSTTTKLSFEEFQKLQETADEATRYELDEGELIVTPSPTLRHDLVSFRLRSAL